MKASLVVSAFPKTRRVRADLKKRGKRWTTGGKPRGCRPRNFAIGTAVAIGRLPPARHGRPAHFAD
jgi:hypothetical protein